MTARVRFVDSIDASPTVRLDLMASPWTTDRKSRFDPPPPKRSKSSNLLRHGSIYSHNLYEDRILDLQLILDASSSDTAADAIQDLARELNRPDGNILEYRLEGQTSSVFFHVVPVASNQHEILTNGPEQLVRAVCTAKPFGYGLMETLGPFTVNNDPAAGSNGMFFDLSGVIGDVETPLKIITPGDSTIAGGRWPLMAVRRRGTPSGAPFILQAEAMTMGQDTAVQSTSALFSGASNNYIRTSTWSVATMASRASVSGNGFPSSASVDARGEYRVFAKVRKTVSTDDIRVQLQWGNSDGMIDNDEVTLADSTELHHVDLGLVNIPGASDPIVDGFTGGQLAAEGIWLAWRAARDAGTGNLELDYLAFVPSDDQLMITEQPRGAGSGDFVWDGPNDIAYLRTSGGAVAATDPFALTSSPALFVTPGVTNRIYYIADVNPDGVSVPPTLGGSTTIDVEYWPAYLNVRPATS